jgi:hypothetical protein
MRAGTRIPASGFAAPQHVPPSCYNSIAGTLVREAACLQLAIAFAFAYSASACLGMLAAPRAVAL